MPNCLCGCKETVSKKKFKRGHWMRLKTYKKMFLEFNKKNRGKEVSINTKNKISKTMKMKGINKGNLNPAWKGNKVKYDALHSWIHRNYGKAIQCRNNYCKKTSKFYEWANISGKYRRSRKDFVMLCRKCHYILDRRTKGEIKWTSNLE